MHLCTWCLFVTCADVCMSVLCVCEHACARVRCAAGTQDDRPIEGQQVTRWLASWGGGTRTVCRPGAPWGGAGSCRDRERGVFPCCAVQGLELTAVCAHSPGGPRAPASCSSADQGPAAWSRASRGQGELGAKGSAWPGRMGSPGNRSEHVPLPALGRRLVGRAAGQRRGRAPVLAAAVAQPGDPWGEPVASSCTLWGHPVVPWAVPATASASYMAELG